MHLYQRISVALRDRILGGTFSPGDRLPSSRALAEEFSTTQVTIHRALAELESHGYIRRRPNAGSFVNPTSDWMDGPAGRGREESGLAGVIAFDTSVSIYWTRTAEAMEDALRSHGYHSVIGHSDHNIETAIDYVRSLAAKGIDGFIYVPIDMESGVQFEAQNARVVDEMEATGLPYVLFDRHLRSRRTSTVTIDNAGGASILSKSLIDLGCKSPICITMLCSATLDEREIPFAEAVRRAGISDPDSRVERVPTHIVTPEHYTHIRAILSRHPGVDGIFCINSSVMNAVIAVLDEDGKLGTIRLVGFNDWEIPRRQEAEVLIEQPVYDFGYCAGELLALRMKNRGTVFGKSVHEILLTTKVVRRGQL